MLARSPGSRSQSAGWPLPPDCTSSTEPLYLLPPLLLAGAVVLGRYPGERALLALATRRARPPGRRQVVASTAPAPLARPPLPRGGLLIASFLAVRPPPGAACLQG